MSKVHALPPTNGIEDAQVRAFCDALANAWQLRNGNTGHDDSQRFITKEEWDAIAGSPAIQALAGLGQTGVSAPGGGGTPGGGGVINLPPQVINLINLLNEPINFIKINNVLAASNELWAALKALQAYTAQLNSSLSADVYSLQNGINQINYIAADSTSASAQLGWAVKQALKDPVTGNVVSQGYVAEINNVSLTSTSASAKALKGLDVQVNDPSTGLPKAHAYIVDLNTVTVDSNSANARKVYGIDAQVNDPNTGLPKAHAYIGDINDVTVTSNSANARKVAGMYADVYDPTTGLSKAHALIGEINDVTANSNSASARQLSAVTSAVGFTGYTYVQSTTPSNNAQHNVTVGDFWIDTGNGNAIKRYTTVNGVTAWRDASTDPIAVNMAGVNSEKVSRSTNDSSLASAVNTVWGLVSNGSAIVQDGSLITLGNNAAGADKWTQVQTALTDPNTGQVAAAAVRTDYNAYVNSTNGKLNASWTTRVNTRSNGTLTVAGIGLLVDGSTNKSAFVVEADSFAVVNPSTAAWIVDGFIGSAQPNASGVYTSGNVLTITSWTSGSGNDIQVGDIVRGVSSTAAGAINTTIVNWLGGSKYTVANTMDYTDKVTLNGYHGSETSASLTQNVPFAIENGVVKTKIQKIYDYIQSDNFNGTSSDPFNHPGSLGWCINRSGDAAFSNVHVNGTLEAGIVKTASVDTENITEVRSSSPGTTSASVTVNNPTGGRISVIACYTGTAGSNITATLTLSGGGISEAPSVDVASGTGFSITAMGSSTSTGSVTFTATGSYGSGKVSIVAMVGKR